MNKLLSGVIVGWMLFMAGIAMATEPPKVAWYQGAVVLADRQVLTGEIVVEPARDLILFKNTNGDGVMVYPAHAVKSIHFHDQTSNVNRKYISQVVFEKGLRICHLYEIVLRGKLTVLRKQKNHGSVVPSDAFDFDYFVMHQNEIIPLGQFREKIYPQLLNDVETELNAFTKREKLNPNLPGDAIRLIKFYNTLRS